ncbi:RNA polymerase sigma factor [bacterium]
MTDKTDNDSGLVKRSKNGDIKAFEVLVNKYQDKLYKSAYWFTGTRDDAFDITQEVFIAAFENINKFKGKSSFFTWLYWLLIDRCQRKFKKKKRLNKHAKITSLDQHIETEKQTISREFADKKESPWEELLKKERETLIINAVNLLKEKYKIPVILCDFQNMPYKQAAVIAKCSEGTLKSRLFRARKILKKSLEKILK